MTEEEKFILEVFESLLDGDAYLRGEEIGYDEVTIPGGTVVIEIGYDEVTVPDGTVVIIDTCDTADCGFETAIRIRGADGGILHGWIIVERYETAELAKIGHDKYITELKSDSLKNIYYYDIVIHDIVMLKV